MGKRRPSHGLASSRKPTGRSHAKKPPLPSNPMIRQFWDASKTVTENYDALGLHVDPSRPTPTQASEELLGKLIGEGNYEKTALKLKGWERKIIIHLTQKYGSDYKAMGRDTKINTYQWTSKQIRRMHSTLV